MKSKQTLIIYGSIAGLIIIVGWFAWSMLMKSSGSGADFAGGDLLGFAFMIVALSMVFFGVRSYRDKERGGVINFKDAFLNGLIIVLVASFIYVIGWEVYYPNFLPNFSQDYAAKMIEQYQAAGMPEAEVQAKQAEMESWVESYKNPIVRMPQTFIEIFPVGLIIALFSALILKRKETPAEA